MEIYFEEVFKYIQPGLLGKIDLKAYSDDKTSFVIAVNDFSEQKELECNQFTIHFKGTEQAKMNKGILNDKWIMTCRGEYNGVLLKKNVKVDQLLINLFNQLIIEIIRKDTAYQYIIQSLNIQILISLLRIICQNLDRYYHKVQAKKILKYLSTNYRANYFEKDIIRDYNYSHYHHTDNIVSKKDRFINKIVINKGWDRFKYSNEMSRVLIFEIKFKDNSFVDLSTEEQI